MTMERQITSASEWDSVVTGPVSHRACEECKRKKTKCDMQRPFCSACVKTQSTCVFPTKRKKPVRKKLAEKQGLGSREKIQDIERFLGQLDPDALQELLPDRLRQALGVDGREPPASPRQSRPSDSSQPKDQTILDASMQVQGSPGHLTLPAEVEEMTMVVEENESLSNVLDHPHFLDEWSHNQDNAMESFAFDSMPDIFDTQIITSQLFSTPSDVVINEQSDNITNTAANSSRLDNPRTDQTGEQDESSGKESEFFSMKVPASVVEYLIELYFSKVQSIVPILHKKRFYARYVNHNLDANERYGHLSLETALLLNSMFALSARFSKADSWNSKPSSRGDSFALEARNLYEEARRRRELDSPTLEYLQGVLLHTYYLFATRPCTRAWVMAGVCSRLAYDQGLHNIDKDITSGRSSSNLKVEEWSEREERRRLWWSIWEVDVFASTISCRPFNIDQSRMHVLLPVADCAWFNDIIIPSAPLGTDLNTLWSSLERCENQDERAWFIVSKALLRICHEAAQSPGISSHRILGLETALSCYELVLSPKYHLGAGNLLFTKENHAKSNWIVYTILSVQSARIHLEFLKPEEQSLDIGTTVAQSQLNSAENFHIHRCQRYVETALTAIRSLSPEYLPLASPFIACSMVATYSVNLQKLLLLPDSILDVALTDNSTSVNDMNIAMIKMSLKHIECYWGIGGLILDFVHAFVDQFSSERQPMNSVEKELAISFRNLMPDPLMR